MDNVPPTDQPIKPYQPPAPPADLPTGPPPPDPRDAQVAMLTVQNGELQMAVNGLTAKVSTLADQEQLVADLRLQLATARQETTAAVQERNLFKAVYEQLDATFTDVKGKLPTKEDS